MEWRQLRNYSDGELFHHNPEALKIVGKSKVVDSEVVSQMFQKIKGNGIMNEPIEMQLNKFNIDMQKFGNRDYKEPDDCKDYIDQFIYYRKLRGYTQEQVGQVIGMSGKSYYKYEKRIHKFKDKEKIEAIARLLGIEKLKMPSYKNKIDNQQLKKYLRDNNITNTEFSKLIGVSRRSIVDWFNKDVEISEDNCIKIKEFIKTFEENKIEEEEME